MADRRSRGSLKRWATAAAVAFAALVVCACVSTPAGTDEPTAGAAPSAPSAPLPGPVAGTVAETDDAAAPGAATQPAPVAPVAPADAAVPPADASVTPDAPATPDAAVVPAAPPARFYPAAGSTQRLAGITPADGARYLERRTVRAGDAPGALEVEVAVERLGGDAPWSARDSYVADVRDDEIRIALAPDPVRAVPPSTRELSLPPTRGAEWTTPAGSCRVDAVDVEVETFAGTRAGCARVLVTGRDGRVTTRWFDPALGEVRREARDRSGRLVAGWALCGDTPPADEHLRALFAR